MDLTPLDAVVRLSWLAAAVAFVIGLSRMSSPATARNGNLVSAGGMAVVAVLACVIALQYLIWGWWMGPLLRQTSIDEGRDQKH